MFYVKSEVSEGVTIRAEITDESVFTACPRCGGEHSIDLVELIKSYKDFDLFGTVSYCAECSEELAAERAKAGRPATHKATPRDAEYFDNMADAMEALIKVWKADGVSPKERYLRLQRAFSEILPEVPAEAFPTEEVYDA